MNLKVLVVDDDISILNLISAALEKNNCTILKTDRVSKACEFINSTSLDLIITDKNMPAPDGSDEGGLSILHFARKHRPECELIMITGYSTSSSSI